MVTLYEALGEFKHWLRGLANTKTFSWGVPFLDAAIGKGIPGSLIVVGGRPNSGKSFFGLLMLASVKVRGLYVSLEDTTHEVSRRVTPMSEERLQRVDLVTPARPRLSIIVTSIREAVKQHGVKLVVVDYLQLVQYDGEIAAWSKTDQVGHIIAELKGLARELEFVLVVNSQLLRPMRGDEEREPTVFDMRDSSNIENSAEVVVLLHDLGEQLRAKVAKNKSGRRGAVATFNRSDNGFLVAAPPEDDQELFGDELH